MSEAVSSDIRQEANSALMEVDKGLRSSQVGEQCEAIVKFPSLMDKFPFPVMTNTALLKLADVFCAPSTANLLRLHILRVFQLVERHLQKVTSVDELVRRLSAVSRSNDPLARALTLRVFGSIASIVAERKSIHHSIHHGLESHNQVEVEAAIFATSCLARHSGTFAAGIWEKIANMVQGLATPGDMKLRLIPILSEMHHNISTATQVRELCLQLLPSYPSFSLVTSTLHTLTSLAKATRVHIPDQVCLLLSYAASDARRKVRLFALRELVQLAGQAPHMWTSDMTQGLFDYVCEAVTVEEQERGMALLLRLSETLAVHNMSALYDNLLPLCYSTHTNTAAFALGTATNIAIATSQAANGVSSSGHVTELSSQVMEALLVGDFSSEPDCQGLHCLLKALVQLTASGSPSSGAMATLPSLLPQFSGQSVCLVCRALVSIAATTPDMWAQATPTLLDYLSSHRDQLHNLMSPLTAVLQELHVGDWGSVQRLSFRSSVLPSLLPQLWSLQHPSRLWLAYRLARRASMMGYHELAEPIYQRLSQQVTVVRFRHWLGALHLFSSAQLLLSSPRPHPSHLIPSLGKAAALISNTTMLTKASSPPSSFPLHYLTTHCALLKAHCQLLTSCVAITILPPSSSAILEQKFQYCLAQFQSLADDLSKLYTSLFDADPATLQYISLLQQSCLLMVSIISSVALSRKPLVSPAKVSTPVAHTPAPPVKEISDFNTQEVLGRACKAVLEHAQLQASSLQSQPVGEEHAQVLSECTQRILQVPFKLPLYFFSSLQHTGVKLAISPPPPAPGQSITLPLHNHLSLKVEGVVQHSGKSTYRSPSAVCVQVNTKLEKAFTHEHKHPDLPSLKRVEPVVNDYFLAQFLLTIPLTGYFTLHIQASLIDQQGVMWDTGPQVNVSLLVDTEQNLKQQQQQQERQKEAGQERQRESSLSGSAKSTGLHGHRM